MQDSGNVNSDEKKKNFNIAFTFTFINLAYAFIQSDLQLRNTISDTL